MNALGWNVRYVRTINTCNRVAIEAMMAEILELPGCLRRRRYLWNLIRGKSFYIPLANCVIAAARGLIYAAKSEEPDLASDPRMARIRAVLGDVVATERDPHNVAMFVGAILKQVNLITLETIPHTPSAKLEAMLRSTKPLLLDPWLDPFGSVLKGYREEIERLETSIELMSRMEV